MITLAQNQDVQCQNIHSLKLQGMRYPAVILPVDKNNYSPWEYNILRCKGQKIQQLSSNAQSTPMHHTLSKAVHEFSGNPLPFLCEGIFIFHSKWGYGFHLCNIPPAVSHSCSKLFRSGICGPVLALDILTFQYLHTVRCLVWVGGVFHEIQSHSTVKR